ELALGDLQILGDARPALVLERVAAQAVPDEITGATLQGSGVGNVGLGGPLFPVDRLGLLGFGTRRDFARGVFRLGGLRWGWARRLIRSDSAAWQHRGRKAQRNCQRQGWN